MKALIGFIVVTALSFTQVRFSHGARARARRLESAGLDH